VLGLVFPRQGAKPWLPRFAYGHHHGRGGPHGQAVATWPFKLCSGFWAVATTGYPWWPGLRLFIRKGANLCALLSLYPLSYLKSLFRQFQPSINRRRSSTITSINSVRVLAILILIKLEKTWKYTLVLSIFYPKDYLWYTANKSYECDSFTTR